MGLGSFLTVPFAGSRCVPSARPIANPYRLATNGAGLEDGAASGPREPSPAAPRAGSVGSDRGSAADTEAGLERPLTSPAARAPQARTSATKPSARREDRSRSRSDSACEQRRSHGCQPLGIGRGRKAWPRQRRTTSSEPETGGSGETDSALRPQSTDRRSGSSGPDAGSPLPYARGAAFGTKAASSQHSTATAAAASNASI